MNFYCLFCNQRCTKYTPDSDMWNCKPCQVNFFTSSQGPEYLRKIIFTHRRPNQDVYQVVLNIEHNETVVEFVKMDGMMFDNTQHIVTFKPMLNNITPSNLAAKLQTILTFQ